MYRTFRVRKKTGRDVDAIRQGWGLSIVETIDVLVRLWNRSNNRQRHEAMMARRLRKKP